MTGSSFEQGQTGKKDRPTTSTTTKKKKGGKKKEKRSLSRTAQPFALRLSCVVAFFSDAAHDLAARSPANRPSRTALPLLRLPRSTSTSSQRHGSAEWLVSLVPLKTPRHCALDSLAACTCAPSRKAHAGAATTPRRRGGYPALYTKSAHRAATTVQRR